MSWFKSLFGEVSPSKPKQQSVIVDKLPEQGYLEFNKENVKLLSKMIACKFKTGNDGKYDTLRYNDLVVQVKLDETLNILHLSTNSQNVFDAYLTANRGDLVIPSFSCKQYTSDQEKKELFNLLQDICRNAELYQTFSRRMKLQREKLKTGVGYEGSEFHSRVSIQQDLYDKWWCCDGRYYTKDLYSYYDIGNDSVKEVFIYSSELFTNTPENIVEFISTIEEKGFVECEDPRVTHWKVFQKQEMLKKKERQQKCHEFIEDVLKQQQEYNDLQIQYEMMPTSPIKDYESFINFCKIVSKEVKYEDYEITNYLLSKGLNKGI